MSTARALPPALVLVLLATAWPAASADPDPVVSTLVGSPGIDDAEAVATDDAGYVYVAWRELVRDGTDGGDGTDTIVVQKLAPDAGVAWTRRLGTDAYDWVRGVATAGGKVVVAGSTWGAWPTTPGAWIPSDPGSSDGWVVTLDASTGALQWSTVVGGNAYDTIEDVDVDNAGNAYVVGLTESCDFPTWNALRNGFAACSNYEADAFVTKLAATGSRPYYSTYLGGSARDMAHGVVASRSSGSAIVVGETRSSDFPTTSGAYDRTHNGGEDMFVTKLASDGRSYAFSTLLGGPEDDIARSVARDSAGNAYVAGETFSPGMPVTPGAHMTGFSGGDCSYEVRPDVFVYRPCPDAYLAKVASTGSALAYATFLGGKGRDVATDVALDAASVAYLTGETNSTDFPRIDGADGSSRYANAFALAVNPKGSTLAYATQLSGSSYADGRSVAARPDGTTYYVGSTDSRGFPTTPNAPRRAPEDADYAEFEGFLVRLGPPASGLVFEHRGGNEWWVEADLGGREAEQVVRLEARDDGGAWTTLARQRWGFWAGTMHVEPGHAVELRATLASGATRTSCAYSHPGGDCTQAPGFDASFSGVKGNEWWVEARVSANQPLAKVEASVDGGAWKALALRSWGAWAASFHVPAGSVVQLRATSAGGATDLSGCYQWTSAAPVACGGGGGGGGGATFDATFTNVRGNEWWVEANVAATGGTLAGVDARVNGGAWVALAKQSWGSWAKSVHAPAGSTVELRARATDGQVDASQAYRWPPG